MTWTNTGGGDHEGADWTPADTTVIAGTHYNISTFTVTNGYTINIDTGNELEVGADTISIVGTIDGNEDGSAGGVNESNGYGAGGGGGGDYVSTEGSGGGGGGYGGAGGQGGTGSQGTPGAGGAQNGTTNTTAITMGSGGGGAAGIGGDYGGRGGGSVYLAAEDITVSGTITCNGGIGDNYTFGAAGGGAGGGILLFGDAVIVSGTLSANGGVGGVAGSNSGSGGGGGGGRVKIFYRTINTAGSTITVTAGAGGVGGLDNGDGGSAGNNTNTTFNTTSSKTFGQEFTPGITGDIAISSIVLNVLAVTTSGDFTLTVYDDTGKGTNYGSKSITVSSTGDKTWTVDNWLILPDGTSQYYFEVVADAGGDIYLSREGNDNLPADDHYFNLVAVPTVIAYEIIYGLGQVINPQVYNIADTTVKTDIANTMLCGSVYRINTDGTGTVDYDDVFTNEKWKIDSTYSGVTHDEGNNELDVADDGYIYYKVDCKTPITGVPTLTAHINITTGTPTIQIAADSAGSPDTWYDIDTAIVDDVDTVYDLDSSSLSFKGDTILYFRIDCTDTGTHTCSIKSFELDVAIHTIDVEHPIISESGVSTFRCDQDSNSGLYCEISLVYRDRSWPA